MAKGAEDGRLIAARNKKAFRDFFILDRYEAGICLMGSEVKSIREHKVNLKDSYARIREGQLYLYNMHVSPYRKARVQDLEPKRTRKLLMHRREIDRLAGKMTDKSLTLVPLEVYFRNNKVKVELALAKGKLKRDKRRQIKEKEMQREMKRALKYR